MTQPITVGRTDDDEIIFICTPEWNVNILRDYLKEHVVIPALSATGTGTRVNVNIHIDMTSVSVRKSKQYLLPILNVINTTYGVGHTTMIVSDEIVAKALNETATRLGLDYISIRA